MSANHNFFKKVKVSHFDGGYLFSLIGRKYLQTCLHLFDTGGRGGEKLFFR